MRMDLCWEAHSKRQQNKRFDLEVDSHWSSLWYTVVSESISSPRQAYVTPGTFVSLHEMYLCVHRNSRAWERNTDTEMPAVKKKKKSSTRRSVTVVRINTSVSFSVRKHRGGPGDVIKGGFRGKGWQTLAWKMNVLRIIPRKGAYWSQSHRGRDTGLMQVADQCMHIFHLTPSAEASSGWPAGAAAPPLITPQWQTVLFSYN